MTDLSKQVYELYIRTTPERLWRAITDGAETPHYFFGSELQPANPASRCATCAMDRRCSIAA
jgi:uncharacterized protein YndB with AHSA1/START domain